MPDHATRGPEGVGALPEAGHHSGCALMERGFPLDNLTAHVHRSYAGLISFSVPFRKEKIAQLPYNDWEPQGKGEKYSLCTRESKTTI